MRPISLIEPHQKELAKLIRNFADKVEKGEIHVLEVSASLGDPMSIGVAHNSYRNVINLQYVRGHV